MFDSSMVIRTCRSRFLGVACVALVMLLQSLLFRAEAQSQLEMAENPRGCGTAIPEEEWEETRIRRGLVESYLESIDQCEDPIRNREALLGMVEILAGCDIRRARELTERVHELAERTRAFLTIARATNQSEGGEDIQLAIQSAKRALELVDAPGDRAAILIAIAMIHVDSKEIGEAVDLAQQAEELVGYDSNVLRRSQTSARIAEGYVKCGFSAKARMFLTAISDDGVRANATRHVLNIEAGSG